MKLLYPRAGDCRGRVGMVIPAWYGSAPAEEALSLLATTLAGCETLTLPEDLLVVVDGCPAAREAAGFLAPGVCAVEDLPENGGKGAAVAAGVARLLEARPHLEWIVIRDADGDHMADDLPHLFRAGIDLAEAQPNDAPLVVVGSRWSVEAPLGWRRAGYEALVNEIIIDALQIALARAGRTWDSRFLTSRIPDLQSGYKLYNRAACLLLTRALTEEREQHPDLDLGRVGMEVVPFCRIVLLGGGAAEVLRKTWRSQPRTSYGHLDLSLFFGSKLAWVLRACQVPPGALEALVDGPLIRSPLSADPVAAASLAEFRRFLFQTHAGCEPPPLLGRNLI